jgi:hypothetical protein
MVVEPWATSAAGRAGLVAPIVALGVVITKSLYTFTDHAADQRPFEWLFVIDGYPGHRSDHCAARLTVVVTVDTVMVMVSRLSESTSGRHKER